MNSKVSPKSLSHTKSRDPQAIGLVQTEQGFKCASSSSAFALRVTAVIVVLVSQLSVVWD